MHSVARRVIAPDVFLTYVSTDKFKTGCLSVNLITGLERSSAAMTALLPRVLRRGGGRHSDMREIAQALDGLYGARIEPTVRKKGELHCVGLAADFVDDDFLPRGERVLEKTAQLLGELLLSPKTRGGLLTHEYVDSERANLINDIRAGINEKRVYVLDKLLENMCSDEAYGTNRLGTEESARAITAKALTRRYQELVAASRVEAFYCGAAPMQRVTDALTETLASMPRRDGIRWPNTDVVLAPPKPAPRRTSEAMDVQQGKLAIGFRLGNCMKAPDYPALMVFNAVFGGSVTSKLFMNVRERLSLCYYASSSLDKHKGVMVVSSGVDFEKMDEARGEIYAQLEAVARGDISDWELRSAKQAVITSVKSAMDAPSGLQELYLDHAIASIKFEPDELAALAGAVTREEVAEIAAGVVVDSEYILTRRDTVSDGGSI
ncbi:MAG: insulinase family protein [Oscillospiraceae bacterium]|jgi:predicted Zn-dependent peptidase|nr:insulinase family protein [Oscillospiraceae bacterium]